MADDIGPDENLWTVQDAEGVTHRAIRQHAGSVTWVVTACDWWKTHNVSGQKAPVRVDVVPTCFACVQLDLARLAT